jgi:hypothetical protein
MKRIFGSCTILLLGLAATQTITSAQATPGLEGVWLAYFWPVNCQTGTRISNVPILVLNMFGHDGSLTNESASLVPTPLRSSGVGSWRHTQGQTYTATFRFFNYNPDGSFMLMRKVTFTITLDGDQYTSVHQFQDFDQYNNPLPNMGCNIGQATRIQ